MLQISVLLIFVTVLPRVDAELVDARRRLGQDVNGVTGGGHVVEEVDGQGRQGKDEHPQGRQHISQHYELHERGGGTTLACIMAGMDG